MKRSLGTRFGSSRPSSSCRAAWVMNIRAWKENELDGSCSRAPTRSLLRDDRGGPALTCAQPAFFAVLPSPRGHWRGALIGPGSPASFGLSAPEEHQESGTPERQIPARYDHDLSAIHAAPIVPPMIGARRRRRLGVRRPASGAMAISSNFGMNGGAPPPVVERVDVRFTRARARDCLEPPSTAIEPRDGS